METKKILIADHENGVVQIISAKLRNNGFEVITASNGDEAIVLSVQQKPDFIVADYELPGISGIDFAQQVHSKPGLSDVHIIMLTTKETELTDKQMEKAGIALCLSKPFSPKEILSKIENLLAGAPTK
jgi:two-component system phosphate regulon response regulator PhoB